MTVKTKRVFLWVGAGIGGAAIAGPLVPFGLFLLWSSRQCAATAEERGWIEPLPTLPEVQQAQQVLVESAAVGNAERPMAQPVAVRREAVVNGDELVQGAVATMERQYETVKAEVEADEQVVKSQKTAINRIKASPYTSRIFLGAQRSGKSYLAAAAAAEVGCDIYHLNLGSNLGEDDTEDERYWPGVKASVCCKLKRLDEDEAAQKVAEAIAVFHRFEATRRPAILIVDEWAEIGSQYHRYSHLLGELLVLLASECASLGSTGMKQKKAIWAIAPMMVAGDMVQSAKVVKTLKLCYVTVPPGRAMQWVNSEGENNEVVFDSSLFEQVQANFKGVSEPGKKWTDDRIAWVGGSWLPIGDLVKL